MASLAAKLKRTFVPQKRQDIFIRSGIIPPTHFRSTSFEKETEIIGSNETFSDKSSETSSLDKYEIEDSYYDGYISPLDKAIMFVIKVTGSVYGFLLACAILIIWIVLGAVYKAPQNWQIVMQDGQSIQCYVWDTLLMRQQLDDNNSLLRLSGRIKSRCTTHKRILTNLRSESTTKMSVDEKYNNVESLIRLQSESYFSKFTSAVSRMLGSLPAIILYWLGVFAWVGCGALYTSTGNDPPFTGERTGSNPQYAKWTDTWQMYINTAVAVVLLVTSVVLENVRWRNDQFVCSQIEEINVLDCKLEAMGRYLTGDQLDNVLVKVTTCERKGFKKFISYYAEVIGTGVGLLITIAVFAVWIGVGHLMGWDSNWWLIIGTYTGLMGYVDGFVLREVYQSITEDEELKFAEMLKESQDLLDLSGINYKLRQPVIKENIGYKISYYINVLCSNQWSVLVSIITVIGLICVASGLRWSVTGQLICNTPTMIIEGFCMMVLIQAHGWADYKRRFTVKELAISRELLLQYYEQKVLENDKDKKKLMNE